MVADLIALIRVEKIYFLCLEFEQLACEIVWMKVRNYKTCLDLYYVWPVHLQFAPMHALANHTNSSIRRSWQMFERIVFHGQKFVEKV